MLVLLKQVGVDEVHVLVDRPQRVKLLSAEGRLGEGHQLSPANPLAGGIVRDIEVGEAVEVEGGGSQGLLCLHLVVVDNFGVRVNAL